jgi:hypothetical protein
MSIIVHEDSKIEASQSHPHVRGVESRGIHDVQQEQGMTKWRSTQRYLGTADTLRKILFSRCKSQLAMALPFHLHTVLMNFLTRQASNCKTRFDILALKAAVPTSLFQVSTRDKHMPWLSQL